MRNEEKPTNYDLIRCFTERAKNVCVEYVSVKRLFSIAAAKMLQQKKNEKVEDEEEEMGF